MLETLTEETVANLVKAITELKSSIDILNEKSSIPKFLFVKDVANLLKININEATKLFKRNDFPSIKDCGRLKVEEQIFIEWCRGNFIKK